MTDPKPIDVAAFKQFERSGWTDVANNYLDAFTLLTTQAVEPLLDAAGVAPGRRVLDVACGPGFMTAAAARRGALATGVDFASTMVELARRLTPGVRFEEGDAEALPFADHSFDAVVIGFGMLHFGDPDRALAEAHRVLASGGRVAFTVWAEPAEAIPFGIITRAIETHGSLDVPLPPGPPFFRFSDFVESARTLAAAGFREARVTKLPLVWRLPTADAVFEAMWNAGVRTRGVLRAQTPEALERIHAAIREGALAYRKGGEFEFPMPAVMSTAMKG